jgi:outer membrane protein
MKKGLLFFALVIFASAISYAQTDQGGMMVGGSLGISSTSYEGSTTKSSSFNFSPSFGYFISDNLAIGAGLGFGSNTTKAGAVKSTSSSFAFGPFARYYKFTSNENFAFYGQASLMIGSGKSAADVKSGSTTFAISPGFSYFLNEHWGLDFQFNLLSLNVYEPNKDANDDKTTTINFGVNSFDPSIGIRYYFGN